MHISKSFLLPKRFKVRCCSAFRQGRIIPRKYLLGESDQTLLVEEAVQAGIGLTLLADESGKVEGEVFSGVLSLSVDLSDVQLNAAVLLSGDQSVGGAALARDVQIHTLSIVVLHLRCAGSVLLLRKC